MAVVAFVFAAAAVLAWPEPSDRTELVTPPTTTTTGASTSTTTTSTTTTTTSSTTTTTSTTVPRSTTTTTTTTTPSVEQALAVRRGPGDRPVVALTFDAGSDVGHTAEILDVLAANGIQATFGMTGRWAESNPALVARMVAEGHQLVNHSYDHPSFTGRSTGAAPLSRTERLDQLARTEQAVRAAAPGASMQPWFRPPYGDEDASVRQDVALGGYAYELLWSVDSRGWQGVAPEQVVERCLDGAEAGAIFLFHVGAASTDHAALQAVIDGVRARGLGFVTAAALLAP